MVTVVLSVPPALVAVMVYVVFADIAVGVPVISPVLVLNDKPAGSPGLIDQVVDAPPVLVADQLLIAKPVVKMFDDGV
jgi:hypothetical protein